LNIESEALNFRRRTIPRKFSECVPGGWIA